MRRFWRAGRPFGWPRRFARGSGHGLVSLGAGEVGQALPAGLPLVAGLRCPVRRRAVLLSPGFERRAGLGPSDVPPPTGAELATLALNRTHDGPVRNI